MNRSLELINRIRAINESLPLELLELTNIDDVKSSLIKDYYIDLDKAHIYLDTNTKSSDPILKKPTCMIMVGRDSDGNKIGDVVKFGRMLGHGDSFQIENESSLNKKFFCNGKVISFLDSNWSDIIKCPEIKIYLVER